MKVLLLGLGGGAAITCALFFIFREPAGPGTSGSEAVERPARPANTVVPAKPVASAPKPMNSPLQREGFARREFSNATGQCIVLTGPKTMELTSHGKTTRGSYTVKDDVIRLSLDGGMEIPVLFETAYGLMDPSGEPEDLFFSPEHQSLAAEMKMSMLERRNTVKAKASVATIVAYTEMYLTKNGGQPPPTLATLVESRIVSDGKLLIDPWGQPFQLAVPALRSKTAYDVYSCGPNKIAGDSDDVGNWEAAAGRRLGGAPSPEMAKLSTILKALRTRPEANGSGN